MTLSEAQRIVDSAARSGLISESEKPGCVYMVMRDPAAWGKLLAARKAASGTVYEDNETRYHGPDSSSVSRASNLGLSQSEQVVCHEMSVEPAEFAAAKRARPHHRDVYGHDASIDINRRTMAAAGRGSNTFVGSASDSGLTSSEVAMAKVLGVPLDRYAGMKPLRRQDPEVFGTRLDTTEMEQALSAGRKPAAPQQAPVDTQAEQVSTLRTSWRGPVPSAWQR